MHALLQMKWSLSTLVGVGDGDVRNRYCLIGFGSFLPLRSAHFRDVDGMLCYPASDFPLAQAQLITEGLEEDGYEAIQFALDNVPFRNSPFIAKNILLITDEGRVVIPEGVGITRESIEQEITVCSQYIHACQYRYAMPVTSKKYTHMNMREWSIVTWY